MSSSSASSSRSSSPTTSLSPPTSPRSIEELCRTPPTQSNTAQTDGITEPTYPDDVKAQLDALRAAVLAHLDKHGTFKPSASSTSILPATHWRDTYAANRQITSVPVTADPRQRSDFSPALYSPSTQPSNWSDSLLYRFLCARKGNVDAAADMFIGYCAWRERYGVDDLARQQPMPFDDLIESMLAHRLHGLDKDGRVIYFQRTGLIPAADFLARVNDDVLVLTHTHFVERCLIALQAASVARGQRISKLVNVIDTTGLTLSHARMIKIFRYTTYIDQNYYPELLGAFYMVRAPSFLPSIYAVARPFLDVRTQEKIHIVSSDSQLKEVMSSLGLENVPKEYGGTCECAGGCVPYVTHGQSAEEEAVVQEMEEADTGKEEAINVSAGKTYEATLPVTVAASMEATVWWRVSIDKKDIQLSVQWQGDDSTVHPLAQPRKIDAGERCGVVRGSAVLTEQDGAGRVRLVFDNSYSRFTSKDVRWRVGVVHREVKLDEALAGLSVSGSISNGTADGGTENEKLAENGLDEGTKEPATSVKDEASA